MTAVERVLEKARENIGYLEKATNSQLDDKTANAGYNNYTKFARDVAKTDLFNGDKNGYAWCDVFVDHCHWLAAGKDAKEAQRMICQTGELGAGCTYSAQYYRNAGRFYSSPEVGDQIFFGDSGDEYHTGIVYKVDSSRVYTIEGNTSGASGVVDNGGGVFKKSYYRNDGNISGYGRPRYDAEQTKEETPKEEPKTITQVAREVLKGKWGNGADRRKRLTEAGYDYEAVQKEVNRLYNSSKNTKSVSELANEVIQGKWGAGDDRKKRLTEAGYDYDAVQNEVNRLLNPKKSNEAIATEVIQGKWGAGAARKQKLTEAGYDYNAIQTLVNKMMK